MRKTGEKISSKDLSASSTASCSAGGERLSAAFTEVFGCQMNKLDAQVTCELLQQQGFRTAADPSEADAVVFFTCCVRQHAEDRFFSRLGRYKQLKQKKPQLKIAVCGCIAEEHGEALLERFPFVDVVCGTRQFHRLGELLSAATPGNPVCAVGEGFVSYRRSKNLNSMPAQAYVAIMRGCSLHCTYCIVPRVRGPEVSRPPDDIKREVEQLVETGVREITLLGQTVNAYGRSLGNGWNLAKLLYFLAEVPGLDRIRFITSHPRFMTDELIEAVASIPQVCEGLHLPAQSGSDRILRRMARGYTRTQYERIVEKCYERIPGFALAGDIIVGFSGETEEDFKQTVDLVEKVGYQNLFVFKYSVRPGTPAAKLPDDVPKEVKERRNNELLAVHRTQALALYRRAVGKEVEVLVEGPSTRNPELFSGRTRTGQIVIFPPGDALVGQLRRIAVTDATAVALYGRLADGESPDGR